MVEEENLTKVVLKLQEKNPRLRVDGLNNIHPMYEALIALLRKQLQDTEIIKIIQDEKSLRAALATDVLLEYLNPHQKNQIKSLLKSNAPIEQIIDRAALQLAEGKRIQDGSILYRASTQNPDKFFKKALKEAAMWHLYIEKGEINRIKQREKKLKKISKVKWITSLALTGILTFGGFYFRGKIKGYKKDYNQSVKIKKQLLSLKNEVSDKNIQLSSLGIKTKDISQKYQEKQGQLSNLENKVESKKGELSILETKAERTRINYEKRISDLERVIVEKEYKLKKINKSIAEPKLEIEGFAENYCELAKHYYEKKDFQKAKELAEKSIELDPNNAWANETLGLVNLEKGSRYGVHQPLEKAIELNPNEAAFQYNFGVYYEKIGNEERAIELYNKAINLEPKFALPYKALGNLYKSKDKKKALYYNQKFLELGGHEKVNEEKVREKISELEKEVKEEIWIFQLEKIKDSWLSQDNF